MAGRGEQQGDQSLEASAPCLTEGFAPLRARFGRSGGWAAGGCRETGFGLPLAGGVLD